MRGVISTMWKEQQPDEENLCVILGDVLGIEVEKAQAARIIDGMDEIFLNKFVDAETVSGLFKSVNRDRDTQESEVLKALAKLYHLSSMAKQMRENPAIGKALYYREMHEHKTADKWETPFIEKAYFLFFPMAMFFCAFFFQNFMLHVATHWYIYDMEEHHKARPKEDVVLMDPFGDLVARVVFGKKSADEVSVPSSTAKVLDTSAVTPAVAYAIVFCLSRWRDGSYIFLWNKTFLVASAMSILKGTFDAATIMPASDGWEQCVHRLGDTLDTMRHNTWMDHPWTTLLHSMAIELMNSVSKPGHFRFCADMLLSGHTYFSVVASLALYNHVQVLIARLIPHRRSLAKILVRFVGTLCVCCVLLEAGLIAVTRFHYTVDVLASIVVVLLLWTNTWVNQLACDWTEGFYWRGKIVHMRRWFPLYRFIFNSWLRPDPHAKHDDKDEVCPSLSPFGVNQRDITGRAPWDSSYDDLHLRGSLVERPLPVSGLGGAGSVGSAGSDDEPSQDAAVQPLIHR